jgi:hypothetical protein
MAYFSWEENLPFKLTYPKRAEPKHVKVFKKSIQAIADMSRRHRIKVAEVKLHVHDFQQPYHALGYAVSEINEITLCGWDVETGLHELAHIWSGEAHTTGWAKRLLQLHQEYSPRKAKKWEKTLFKQYRSARTVIKERDDALPRKKSVRRCHSCGKLD